MLKKQKVRSLCIRKDLLPRAAPNLKAVGPKICICP